MEIERCFALTSQKSRGNPSRVFDLGLRFLCNAKPLDTNNISYIAV